MCPSGKELSDSRCGQFDQRFGRKLQPFLCHVFVIKVHFKFALLGLQSQGNFVKAGFFFKSLFLLMILIREILDLG